MLQGKGSLVEGLFEPRIKNLNGKIIYTHTPETVQHKSKAWVRIFQNINLSGDFANSKFSNLNGELGLKNGEPLKKITTRYHLDSSDLNWIIEDDAKDSLLAFQEGMDFTSGKVLVDYRFKGNPEKQETGKKWGKIELKDLSLKYRDRLQAMTGLNGKISYDGKKIQ